MKTLLTTLLGLLFLSACAAPLQPRIVDPALEPYVQKFEALWGQQIHFTVEFSKLDPKYEGMCTVSGSGRTVDISSLYWDGNTEPAKRQLIYHEMGHCALNRGHWSVLDGNPAGCTWDLNGNCSQGYPLTIMYPVIFGDDGHYEPNENAYIQELFQNNPTHEDTYSPNKSLMLPPQDDDFRRLP